MPDRDAEITAMVDEYCPVREITAQQARHMLKMRKHYGGANWSVDAGFPVDYVIATDETPLADVLHAGVIGTEE